MDLVMSGISVLNPSLTNSVRQAVDRCHTSNMNTCMTLATIHLILKFIQPTDSSYFERCLVTMSCILPKSKNIDIMDILGFNEPEFIAWVYKTYGPYTIKKFYELKSFVGPKLPDILKYQYPDSTEAEIETFIDGLTDTEQVVLLVWLDRIADPDCAMIKSGNTFNHST